MVFSSSVFIFIYLPIVIALYYLLSSQYRNAFLFLASLCFYAYGEPKFVFVMIMAIILNYFDALIICKFNKVRIKRLFLIIGILLNLSVLIVFKYCNFITGNLKNLFPNIPVTYIVLPIGISFFTFQALSYLIDVYRGEMAQKNFFNLGLYISFFPQLVAGPIVRYKSISKEIENRTETWKDFSEGIVCFLNGLIKKIVIANNMAIIADKAFGGNITQQGVLFSWLGALAYSLQIYFDFSGYSDMALGLGRMFGFHFDKNFDYPYSSGTLTEFWRRWHISLGLWFRDYVYIPLGGSKKGNFNQVRNLFIVWLLTGIWHGANWTFIIWGLIYFLFLVVEKYFIKPERFKRTLTAWLYRILVLLLVLFCWVLFRSESISSAIQYCGSMFGLCGNPVIDNNWLWYSREYLVLILIGVFASLSIARKTVEKIKKKTNYVVFGFLKTVLYIFMLVVCISYLVTGAHNPFIYFNF